jgi:hypothetical protein
MLTKALATPIGENQRGGLCGSPQSLLCGFKIANAVKKKIKTL